MKEFDSPTTPNLKIDLPNYLVELVCLNMRPKLKPRFWKDDKYWSKKYVIERKGVKNLFDRFENTDNISTQRAMIYAIKKYVIKSLSRKTTIDKLARIVPKIASEIDLRNKTLALDQETREIGSPNYKFRGNKTTNILGKVRKIENAKENTEN